MNKETELLVPEYQLLAIRDTVFGPVDRETSWAMDMTTRDGVYPEIYGMVYDISFSSARDVVHETVRQA